MKIILLGPQGSGKGTQADLLHKNYSFMHMEMGKVLRSIAKSDNEYAPKIKETLTVGGLVPDEYVRLIAWDYINRHIRDSIVFEGYPRSLAQYRHLQDMLKKFNEKIAKVINLNIPESETILRLAQRRTCVKCGKVYEQDGSCTDCGGELLQREDDKPEAIKRRLSLYHSSTRPVYEASLAEGIAVEIDGTKTISDVHATIVRILGL
jgi:adenylate kinase